MRRTNNKLAKFLSSILAPSRGGTISSRNIRSASIRSIAAFLLAIVVLAPVTPSYGAVTTDPGIIGMGARPLGMGRAVTGMGLEGDAIFVNPAGLAWADQLKLTNMYSTLIGDVNYLVLGGALPLQGNAGTVGVGLITSGVPNIPIFSSTAGRNQTPSGFGSTSSSVLLLGYANSLDRILPLTGEIGKQISIGGNFKIFDQSTSGTSEATAANGRGFDMDLGILYSPTYWSTIGFVQKNFLPSSLGGKMTFESGLTEGISSTSHIGGAIRILGPENWALNPSEQQLTVTGDLEFYPQRASHPSSVRIGAEYWPVKFLALRAGVDQDPSPTSASSGTNLTFGVGFRYAGLEFNYAYHPFSNLNENVTSFFSIGWVGPDKEAPQAKDGYLTLFEPADKIITYAKEIKCRGIVEPEVFKVEVNGVDVKLNKTTHEFSAMIPLDIGKNILIAKAFAEDGRLLGMEKRRIISMASFPDVTEGFWAKKDIEEAATTYLVEGYPDGNFKPANILNRAELTTIMVRLKSEKVDDTAVLDPKLFKDLPRSHWAAKYIAKAMEVGLVIGYPDKTFRAYRNINRAENVLVATRFDGVDEKQVVVENRPYPDVPVRHWAAGGVEYTKEEGMLTFVESLFKPKIGVNRAEAVSILTKTKFGAERIANLYNWERGPFVLRKDITPTTQQ